MTTAGSLAELGVSCQAGDSSGSGSTSAPGTSTRYARAAASACKPGPGATWWGGPGSSALLWRLCPVPPATPPFRRLFTPGDSPATRYASSGLLHPPWSPFSGPHHLHFVNDDSLPGGSISGPISGCTEGQPWEALGAPSTSRMAQDGEGANGSRPQSFRPPVPQVQTAPQLPSRPPPHPQPARCCSCLHSYRHGKPTALWPERICNKPRSLLWKGVNNKSWKASLGR